MCLAIPVLIQEIEGTEAVVEIGDGPRRRVHPPQQDRLVLDGHAVVHEQLTGPSRLIGAFLGMVEMSHDEERRLSPQQPHVTPHSAHRGLWTPGSKTTRSWICTR